MSLVLSEGRIDDLQKKYTTPDEDWVDDDWNDDNPKGKLSNKQFLELVNADPSPTKKYLEWMVKRYISEPTKRNDIVSTIDYFHKNVQRFQKKDINSYKTVQELEDLVKNDAMKRQNIGSKKGNAKKLYEDSDILLVRPDNKQAVMTYGANTRWCITMKDSKYYEQYIQNNVVFYFFINKKTIEGPFAKIALAISRFTNNDISTEEFFDAEDNPLEESEFISAINETDDDGEDDGIESLYAQKMLDMARKDAATVPKSVLAKLRSNEKISDEELIQHWKLTFNEEERSVSSSTGEGTDEIIERKLTMLKDLTFQQQRTLISIDQYVRETYENGDVFICDSGNVYIYKFDKLSRFVREKDGKVFAQRVKFRGVHSDLFIENLDDGELETITQDPSDSDAYYNANYDLFIPIQNKMFENVDTHERFFVCKYRWETSGRGQDDEDDEDLVITLVPVEGGSFVEITSEPSIETSENRKRFFNDSDGNKYVSI